LSKGGNRGVRGEGGRPQESLDPLRTSCGICGERLGVDVNEAMFDERESTLDVETVLRGGRLVYTGAAESSMSRGTFWPMLFLPSIIVVSARFGPALVTASSNSTHLRNK